MRRPLTRAEVADRVLSMSSRSDAGGTALYELALEEGKKIIADDSAKCESARALVGVYAALHVGTYKSEPEEIRSRMIFAALAAAKKLVAEEFSGDYERAVDFVAWAFARERGKAEPRRLTWRHLFGTPRYIFSDWLARKGRKKAS